MIKIFIINMITNKTVCKIKYFTVLLRQFIEAVPVTFVAIVFVNFVDTISITVKISSHLITEV